MSETTETKVLLSEEILEDVIHHIHQTSKDGQLVEKTALYAFLKEPVAIAEEDLMGDDTSEDVEKSDSPVDEEPSEQLKAMMTALMAALEASEDIELKVLTNDAGAEYLYSATHMTDQYAAIVMSVNNKNYLKLIADTVRHESQKYPRATRISLFTKRPYNLTEGQLLGMLSAMSTDSAYADLKYTEASNGVKFLYSELHLTERHAKSLAEWEEVTSKEIP